MSTQSANVCCIKGCDLPAIALGLCNKHWRRNKKYGSPVAFKSHSGLTRGLNSEQRFWLQVKKSNSCWLWTASKDRDGYGVFRGTIAGKTYTKAHRFSYSLHTGEIIPDGKVVMHACDNPMCVNPGHLSIGTNLDNMRDKIRKGRSRAPFGEATHTALLTEKQVMAIALDPRPYAQIATDFNVATSTIGSIKQRKSWKYLSLKYISKAKKVGIKGSKQWSTHLSESDIKTIRKSKLAGKDLAKQFNVSPQTICDIKKRRSWKHVK